ncbi:MAG: hypothetical protein RIT02_2316, partial [Planctomycetota bacterium]
MPLTRWIKETAQLLARNPDTAHRRARQRKRRYAASRFHRPSDRDICAFSEPLEDRALPASLVWVGDINPLFQTDTSGNTNWDTNTLPASGDQLTFP